MAEMAETACSDAAYLGYEYPAFAGHSFADTLANHNEISVAASNGSNNGSSGRDSHGNASSDADSNTGGNVNRSSDDHEFPDADDVGHDVGHGVYDEDEDDIEVDNVRESRLIHSR